MPKISTITHAPQVGMKVKASTQPISHQLQTPAPAETPPVAAPTDPGGQNSTVEAKVEATPLDPKYEVLAKKESALRTLEKELKAKETSIADQVKAAVDEALKGYRARLKEAPLDVLNEEGLTYDQLVEQAVNAPDPITRATQQEIKSIKDAQAKMSEDIQNSAKAQRESAVNQIRYDVTELVESDPNFETIKGTGSVEDVVELITKTFDESGKLLTIDQAAKMVEDELFEEALKIASLSKVKSKLTPQQAEPKLQSIKQPQQSMTLTNSMSSSKPMTPRERAVAAFKGEKF